MDLNIPPEYYERAKPATATVTPSQDPRYHLPEYIVRRRILTLLGSALDVIAPDGWSVLFCRGKAFRIKEDLRIYDNPSKTTELLSISARQWIDFSAAYDVRDSASGEWIGTLKRKGWRSLIQDRWEIYDPGGLLIGSVEEDSLGLALLRRFLTDLIPQSYDIRNVDGELLAEGKQFFNPFVYKLRVILRDHYARTKLDRRLILASAVLLATIEGRQSS